jgi:hypothetical protein
MEDEALTRKIIGCAMTIHRALGPGFLLTATGLDTGGSCRIPGGRRGRRPSRAEIQRLSLPREGPRPRGPGFCRSLTGLLLNFGADSLQFKRKSRKYSPKGARPVSSGGSPAVGGSSNPANPVNPV